MSGEDNLLEQKFGLWATGGFDENGEDLNTTSFWVIDCEDTEGIPRKSEPKIIVH